MINNLKSIWLIIIILCSTFNLQSKSEIIIKDSIFNGNTIKINYINDNYYDNLGSLKLIIHLFNYDSNIPQAIELNLDYVKELKELSTKFVIPKNAIYFLVEVTEYDPNFTSFFEKDLIDNNKGSYWDYLVYDKGKIQENAYLYSAYAELGNNDFAFEKRINFLKAKVHFENELKLYPNNSIASLGLLSLSLDLKEISYEEFNSKGNEILKKLQNTKNQEEQFTKLRLLKMLNKSADADKLEEEIIKNFPNSKIAEDVAFRKISSSSSFNNFKSNSFDFINTFKKSQYTSSIFNALYSSYNQKEISKDFINDIFKYCTLTFVDELEIYSTFLTKEVNKNYDKNVHNKYTYLQNYIEKTDSLRKLAFNNDLINQLVPENISKTQYLNELQVILGNLDLVKAKIELSKEKLDSNKYLELLKSGFKQVGNKVNIEDIDNLCFELISIGLKSEAEIILRDAVLNLNKNIDILDLLNDYYYKKDTTKIINKLIKQANDKRVNYICKNLFSESFTNNNLRNINGEEFHIDSLKGKNLLIMLLSSWCGPCQAAFPAFDSLLVKYEKDSTVHFYGVDIWEKTNEKHSAIELLMSKSPVLFPILIDEKDKITKDLSINGLPVFIYIDRNSNVRKIKTGFVNYEELISDVDNTLEAINKCSTK
ncbi:MAG: TlpA disulfide reductase family protein [Candidatus Kapabacteria bacterium]|nr:TlpA disulfide reductase family protein [Candidatus Kapabacteria bacterium]